MSYNDILSATLYKYVLNKKNRRDVLCMKYFAEIQGSAHKLNGLLPALMLVSHCGEYPCECKKIYSRQIRQIVANIWRMDLRMQFATNRNDRKMIARYS